MDKGQYLLTRRQSPGKWRQGDRHMNSHDSERDLQEDRGDIKLDHEGARRGREHSGTGHTVCGGQMTGGACGWQCW